MNRYALLVLIFCCAVLLTATTAEAQFFFTGSAGGDFFDEFNWTANSDGTGANPTVGSIDPDNDISLSLIIDGDSVIAAGPDPGGSSTINGDLDLTGSLDIRAGSLLDVTVGELRVKSGGIFDIAGATLNITDGSGGQFDTDSGSTVTILDSTITASDDIFFGGAVSVQGSTIESTDDDIEWQDSGTAVLIDNSSFTVRHAVSDNETIFIEVPATITNSQFFGGRLSLQNPSIVSATDTDFNMVGDVEDAFNSISQAILTLAGDSTLTADQLEEGITLILQDSATASFIDDNSEGEWITNPIAGVISTVILESTDASVSFVGPQGASDDATQIIFGIPGNPNNGTSYADNSSLFTPSNWNGQDDVTIRLVPEPSSLLLASILLATMASGSYRGRGF